MHRYAKNCMGSESELLMGIGRLVIVGCLTHMHKSQIPTRCISYFNNTKLLPLCEEYIHESTTLTLNEAFEIMYRIGS